MAREISATGSCLCTSVQYSIKGTDKNAVLCHCDNCKKGSGSAFAHNHRFTKAKLDFTAGGDFVTEYADKNTNSGNTLLRHFCSKCGSPIYMTNSAFPGLIICHAGLLSIGKDSKPKGELFTEDKRSFLPEFAPKL